MTKPAIDANGNIQLSADDLAIIGKLNRRKTLSTIFWAAASAGSAALTVYALAEPTGTFNFINTNLNGGDAVETAARWRALLSLVPVSIVMTLALGSLLSSRMRDIGEKLSTLKDNQIDSYNVLLKDLFDKAQQEAVAGLHEKEKAGQPFSQNDYDVLAMCQDTVVGTAPESMSATRMVQTRLAGRFYSQPPEIPPGTAKPKDYTNTLWMLPAVFTFALPYLALLTYARMKTYAPEDFQIKAPAKPDLYDYVAKTAALQV